MLAAMGIIEPLIKRSILRTILDPTLLGFSAEAVFIALRRTCVQIK